jgi:NAD(P)-dependent dehydrogenase (short-subunit alcohol dehydrogenase family)
VLLGRDQTKLESVYDQIEKEGGPQPALVPINLETATAADYEQLTTRLTEAFGKLDGVLHSAGILGELTPLEFYPATLWESVLRINLTAGFMLTQSLIPLMRKSDSASVIFTTSSVGRKGRSNWGAYAISKFAVEGLTQTWAEELLHTAPIRVNCINPGATRTNMRAKAYPAEDPNRLPTPDAIMKPYLFLMCTASAGVSGHSIDAQSQGA